MNRQTIKGKIFRLILSGVLLFSLGAVVFSPQPVSAAGEQALSFDGTDDYVDCGNNSSLSFGAGDFTIEAWVKNTSAGGDFEWAITKAPYPGSTGWRLGISADNKYVFKSVIDGITVEGLTAFTQGAWAYVVVTRSGTTLKIYLNGVEDRSSTLSSNFVDTNRVILGGTPNPTYTSVVGPWTGLIDEVRISNAARTPAEITAAWNGNAGKRLENDASTAALWHMDEGSGGTIYDETGINNGTIYGPTWVVGFPFPVPAPVQLWRGPTLIGTYLAIQEAVNDAMDGDDILVLPGTYDGQIVIDKQVTVKSQDGAATTIIDAQFGKDIVCDFGEGVAAYPAVWIQRDGVIFGDMDMGFTLRNTPPMVFPEGGGDPSEWGVAILALAPGCTIRGNTIEDSNPMGIFADVDMTIISQNTVSASIMGIFSGGGGGSILYNTVDSALYGIIIESQQGGNNISNNTVSNSWGYAITVQLGDNNQITNNLLLDSQRMAIGLQNTSNATVSGNTISSTTSIAGTYGIEVERGQNNDISGNIISDVLVGGISLNNTDENSLSANDISDIDGYIFSSANGASAGWTRDQVKFDRYSVKLETGPGTDPLGVARLEIPTIFPFQYAELGVGGELYFWAYLQDTALLPTYQIELDNGVILRTITGCEAGLNANQWLKLSAMGFWTNVATTETKALSAWIIQYSDADVVKVSVVYRGAADKTVYIDGSEGEDMPIEPPAGIVISGSRRNEVSGSTISYVSGDGILILESYQNIIGDNNTITENGWSGIVIENSNENTVSGSTISNNQEGIIITQSYNNQIIRNDITGNTGGMSGVHLDDKSSGNEIHANNIVGNTGFGVIKDGGNWVNATGNWWGDASGPYHEWRNPGGTGDAVSNESVHFEPWADTPLPEYELPTIVDNLAMPRMTAVLGMFMGGVGPESTTLVVEAYDDDGGVGIARVTVDLASLLINMLSEEPEIPPEKQEQWDKWLSELEKSQLWHCDDKVYEGVYQRNFKLQDDFIKQLTWYLGEDDTQRIMEKLTLGDVSIQVTVADWCGNEVSGNIDLTIVDIMQPLKKGWNLISTPVRLAGNYTYLMDIFDLGGGSIGDVLVDVIWYDPVSGEWVGAFPDDELKPLYTYYIYVSSNTQIGSIFSREPTLPPTLDVEGGWNLVGLAIPPTDWDSMPVNEAMVTVEDASGYRGYSIVVSPDQQVNYKEEYQYQDTEDRKYGFGGYDWNFKQTPWVYTVGSGNIKEMSIGGGYWVFMEGSDTLAGFSTTPVTIVNAPEPGNDPPMVPRYDRERVTRTLCEEYHDGKGYTKMYLTYSGDVSPSRVVEFYQQRMSEYGWTLTPGGEYLADSASLDFARVAGDAHSSCHIDVVGGESIDIQWEVWEPGVDLPDVPRFDWGPVAMTAYSQVIIGGTDTQTNISYEGELRPDEAYKFYQNCMGQYPYNWKYIGNECQNDFAWLMFKRSDEQGRMYICLIWAEKGLIEIEHHQYAASVPDWYIDSVISSWWPKIEMRKWAMW